MKRRNLWGQEIEIPEKPPKLTPAQKRRLEAQKRKQERKERETTDIEEWLKVSGPQNIEEMDRLRTELKRRRGLPVPPFSKSVSQSYDSMKDIWRITGYAKTLVLPTEKARRYFRKRLKLRERSLMLHSELGIAPPTREVAEPKRRRTLVDIANEHQAKQKQE